jgi:hypothetical protein
MLDFILEIVWQQYYAAHLLAHLAVGPQCFTKITELCFNILNPSSYTLQTVHDIGELTLCIMVFLSHLLLKAFKGQQTFKFDPTFVSIPICSR